ncbi:MAG: hypothetical protein PWR03_1089 [Tenuifilum sp.]|jgi:tRNA U34 5-methylaminomethyl-2-thiouridine-forming methyltransferase MnmC|uniref:tRNA (5-methylaminomethyl-2-thiouridine)(34)-methyltransferase MnmD n=1 Tax=Tenuifilum sp. TaxID=2760880 RepID=UPI0024AA6A6F|nr:tRNA (5-methylaminomethyl-2-thiouridine)(34)-methyltransferase MnmD [Tenuifilum sp.]MDI3526906.1 hypothetical protein [Tenuifilum sp.]
MAYLKVVPTSDGSPTLFSDKFNSHYHSINGAITESNHVFINAGFKKVVEKRSFVRVLEVGLGTCLNAALTAVAAEVHDVKVEYFGIEMLPPEIPLLKNMISNFNTESELKEQWIKVVQAPFGESTVINNKFSIHKIEDDFCKWIPPINFDVVYFDAFAPDDQPEMWSIENFKKLFLCLNPNGILATYSAKGVVKQNLRDAGFKVERLSGPPGKRHMIRAVKVA